MIDQLYFFVVIVVVEGVEDVEKLSSSDYPSLFCAFFCVEKGDFVLLFFHILFRDQIF